VGEEEDKVVASLGYVQGVEQSMEGELQTIVVFREREREREREGSRRTRGSEKASVFL
jgi:hypothetical protein